MTHLGYLIAGWAISFGLIVLYAIRLCILGSRLSKRVPDQQRRWLDSPRKNSE